MRYTTKIWMGLVGLAAMAIGWLPEARAAKQTVNGVEWTYAVSNGEASVFCRGYTPAIPRATSGAIVVPSDLGGCPVTSIGNSAFYGCSQLTGVTIPNSVTRIEERAFSSCDNLAEIAIPDDVTFIGKSAFSYCRSLRTITIPSQVSYMGGSVFENCSRLTEILVDPDNPIWTSVDGVLFSKNKERIVYYPTGKTGAYAIPGSVKDIHDGAFSHCSGLTRVTIPNSVKSIGQNAFQGCSGLTSLTIPNGVTNLGWWAFDGCSKLKSVSIGNGLKSVGSYVFSGCANLQTVTVGKKVKSFAYRSFSGCDKLKKLYVPVGWKGKSDLWLAGVPSKCKIVYVGHIQYNANGGKVKPASAIVPNNRAIGSLPTPTRPGYKFTGWFTAAKGGSKVTRAYKVTANRTLYAHWQAKPYKVAFKANGGTGKMAVQTMVYDKSAKLSKNAFKRRGYLFLGWGTEINGPVVYKDAASVKNLRADGTTVTLYAIWERAQTAMFNANGGTCATKEREYKVGKIYGSLPVPTRRGYTFLGWFTAASGGQWVSEMDIAEATGERRLHAHWEPMPLQLGATSESVGPGGADKLSVAVSSKKSWTAWADADWIVLRTKSGKAGKGKFVYDVKANKGGARKGRIVVSAGGKALAFTVTQKARTLKLSAASKLFSAKAATGQKLGVTATVSWTAKSSAKWLKLKTAKGSGNGTIVYEIAANTGLGRAATITVAGGGLSASFRVEQKGKDGSTPNAVKPTVESHLAIEPDTQTVEAGGTTNGMAMVVSDISWTASTRNSWIELLTEEGSGCGALMYRVAANAGNMRTGTVTVAGGKLKATLKVEQLGKKDEPPYLLVSPEARTTTALAAENVAVWVEANVAWTAGTSADWITVKTESGRGNGKIAYSISANQETGKRTGTITVRGGGMTAVFTLTQEGKTASPPPAEKYLRVNPGSRMHGNGAESGAFLVEANVGWAASADRNWIVVNTHSGKNNGSVSYSIAENSGGERSGTITVSGAGMTATFTVGQGGKIVRPPPPPPVRVFEVLPRKMELDWQDRELECVVNSSVPWVAYSYNPHIHVTTTEGIAGTWSIHFRIDENASVRSPQIGRVYARSKNASLFLSDSCMVVQAPRPRYLDIRPHSMTIPWKGAQNKQCKVYTLFGTQNWYIKAFPDEWLERTGQGFFAGHGGDGYITFNVPENDTDEERTGKIIVSDGETDSTCVVTQEKGVVLTVTPEQPPIQSYKEGYGPDLTVKSSVKWTATVTDGTDWIQLTRSSGNRPGGIIRYKLKENKTPSAREGTINVTGGGKTVWVSIRQAPGALPNLAFYTPDGWPAAAFVTTDEDSKVRRTTFYASSTPSPCIRYAWKNSGEGKAETYTVKEVVTGPEPWTHTTQYLGMNVGQIATMHWYYGPNDGYIVFSAPASAGTYNWTITLDSGNAVKEENENDNATNVTFTVVGSRSIRGAGKKDLEADSPGAVGCSGQTSGESPVDGVLEDTSDWIAVTASGGENAGAVIDGDEETCWSPEETDGSWVVLTFSEAVDVEDVEVVGDRLPEGMRILLSEDADTWREGEGGTAHYVWVVFPAAEEIPVVKEIVVQ